MFKKILPAIALVALFVQPIRAQQQQQTKTGFEKYQEPGGTLPELKIVTGKYKTLTNKDFKSKHHFFLVMFNPTCRHCINMTKLICANAQLFKDTKVAFMAPASMMSYLSDFYTETQVFKHPEFAVGVDSAYAVDKLYTFGTLPQINIYDNDAKLVKTFKGDTPLDSLKHYLP
ncbi:MAG TPA: hypothetical protein VFL76_02690 [Edaphocola sp.]|nr:hypothetical protein [Edaphocola sp.]